MRSESSLPSWLPGDVLYVLESVGLRYQVAPAAIRNIRIQNRLASKARREAARLLKLTYSNVEIGKFLNVPSGTVWNWFKGDK